MGLGWAITVRQVHRVAFPIPMYYAILGSGSLVIKYIILFRN